MGDLVVLNHSKLNPLNFGSLSGKSLGTAFLRNHFFSRLCFSFDNINIKCIFAQPKTLSLYRHYNDYIRYVYV